MRKHFVILILKLDPQFFKVNLPLFLLFFEQLPLSSLFLLHFLYLHGLLVHSIRFHLLFDLILYLRHQIVHVHLLLHLLHLLFIICCIFIIVKN
jgi:hypothetical protein